MAAGRPSMKTPELIDELCRRLAEGESLRTICKDDHMPERFTVIRWTHEDKEFNDQYARAKEQGVDAIVDEAMEIADETTNDPARDRLRVDTRKWYASKIAAKRYGDKIETKHTGEVTITTIRNIVVDPKNDST